MRGWRALYLLYAIQSKGYILVCLTHAACIREFILLLVIKGTLNG